MQFKTEVNELLQLMIHSLYSNKEIFLRELISNASDALDKRSLARAKGEDAGTEALQIRLSCDEEAKLLIIEDSGCGMSAAELEENLGTIAHSGTKAFMAAAKNDADASAQNTDLIGQFGVGFYSAFMVADRIEVFSRRAGEEAAHCWSSDASGYEITPAAKDAAGTKIVLHLKDAEFSAPARIEHLVRKYSKHINYAILLEKEIEKDGQKRKEFTQINTAQALWKQPKTALKAADYEQFYAELFYGAKPLGWVHTNSEGALSYDALFYLPESAPHDLFMVDYERQCKLYVRRVLISEQIELLPVWLRFVRGIVDVADLELNVSREILQDDAKIKKISAASAKRIVKKIAGLEGEARKIFNEQFGAVLKEGLLDGAAEHESIYKALDFTTSAGQMSLDEYIKNHANEEKKEIYFLQAPSAAQAAANALVAGFSAVIFFTDKVDEFLCAQLPEYKGYKWVNIAEAKVAASVEGAAQNAMAQAFKQHLGAKINGVKFSANLGEQLAAIVYDADDQMYQMHKMMARFGAGEKARAVGDLLLNSEHELIKTALDGGKFGLKQIIAQLADGAENAAENAAAENSADGAENAENGAANNDDASAAKKLAISEELGKLANLCYASAAISNGAELEDLQNLLSSAQFFAQIALNK